MEVLRAVTFFLCLIFIHAKVLDLSCKQIRELVDGHNSRRLRVAKGLLPGQPAASKMSSMVWDDELAKKAAAWASHNQFAHNPDRTIPSGKFRTGENIYIFSTTETGSVFDPKIALDSWFDEHKHYRYKALTKEDFTGPVVGHYTQMVWADSVYVGCAVSQYEKNRWTNYLVVCNYGPGGNKLRNAPYPSGRASNKLVCGSGNCSQPYGNKCARRSYRSVFLNDVDDNSHKNKRIFWF